MTNPPPFPPCDLLSDGILVCLFPYVGVLDFVCPSGLEDVSEASVNEDLNLIGQSVGDSPGLRAVEEDRLDVAVKNPEFSVDR